MPGDGIEGQKLRYIAVPPNDKMRRYLAGWVYQPAYGSLQALSTGVMHNDKSFFHETDAMIGRHGKGGRYIIVKNESIIDDLHNSPLVVSMSKVAVNWQHDNTIMHEIYFMYNGVTLVKSNPV